MLVELFEKVGFEIFAFLAVVKKLSRMNFGLQNVFSEILHVRALVRTIRTLQALLFSVTFLVSLEMTRRGGFVVTKVAFQVFLHSLVDLGMAEKVKFLEAKIII